MSWNGAAVWCHRRRWRGIRAYGRLKNDVLMHRVIHIHSSISARHLVKLAKDTRYRGAVLRRGMSRGVESEPRYCTLQCRGCRAADRFSLQPDASRTGTRNIRESVFVTLDGFAAPCREYYRVVLLLRGTDCSALAGSYISEVDRLDIERSPSPFPSLSPLRR